MRYFKATIAYSTLLPEKGSANKELAIFCCDDIFPPDAELRRIFYEIHNDKQYLHSSWHEIRLSDIPVSELIHPLCVYNSSQPVNAGMNHLSMS